MGGNLVTSREIPVAEIVYKLVQTEENGKKTPSMKFSDGKRTYPGEKSILRIVKNGKYQKDVLALKVEGDNLPPLELIMPANENILNPTRVIIILEEKAKLELLQIALGSGCSAHSHLLEIHLNKGSKVEHGFVALGSSQASCLAKLSI